MNAGFMEMSASASYAPPQRGCTLPYMAEGHVTEFELGLRSDALFELEVRGLEAARP